MKLYVQRLGSEQGNLPERGNMLRKASSRVKRQDLRREGYGLHAIHKPQGLLRLKSLLKNDISCESSSKTRGTTAAIPQATKRAANKTARPVKALFKRSINPAPRSHQHATHSMLAPVLPVLFPIVSVTVTG
jgi:hypothetical protein